MQNQRRHLDIPYLPELDSMTLDQAVKYLDEKGEHQTIDHLNWKEQYPYRPLTAFTIAHSDTQIYIDFFTRCNYLRAVNYKNNSDVYQDSCVEFFVAPHGEAHYYNSEFTSIGTINAARRMDRHSGEKLTDEQLDSVRRLASCGTRPFEELQGIFSWNLLAAIPLSLIGVSYEPGNPVDMRANFYKCADATSEPHYLSWAPITTPQPDFHRPEFFGDITLL